jgi:hypothetical protein
MILREIMGKIDDEGQAGENEQEIVEPEAPAGLIGVFGQGSPGSCKLRGARFLSPPVGNYIKHSFSSRFHAKNRAIPCTGRIVLLSYLMEKKKDGAPEDICAPRLGAPRAAT